MRRSRALSLVLMAVLAALPWAPRAHVHDVRGADGHEHRVAHSHREAHRHVVDHDRDHEHHAVAMLDHDETVIATVEPVFTLPATQLLTAPVPALLGLIPEPPQLRRLARTGFVERLIHGPPRAPDDDRGPPSTSRL